MADYIRWFDELGIKDVPLVGGKNASLGEMYSKLTDKGVAIPNGFAITAEAYRYLLKAAGIEDQIKHILSDLNTHDINNLRERGHKVRAAILKAEFPHDLNRMIMGAYAKLCREYGANTDVAVRSSATAEDLPDASFAGQQETYLNIKGDYALLEACKKCFASLFTDRAISYRVDKGFDHFQVALSIGVQKMVRSDKAAAGVIFTIDTESGFKDVVYVTSSYGLGEMVVQGAVNPDQFYVFKPTLKKGFKPIISKTAGLKSAKLIYAEDGSKNPTKQVQVIDEDRRSFSITDAEVLKLAKWACIIEDHYKKPMDLEWAKDGITNRLFIVQARPETVQSQKDVSTFEEYLLLEKGKLLVTGRSVGSKIGAGEVAVIKNTHDMPRFRKGQILVTDMTDPDWEPVMKIASAIVTNRGGRTCHAAIVSRELGIPCVVGTLRATEVLKNGQGVTVSCAEGEEGRIYSGVLKYRVEKTDLKKMPKTKTMIMMNVGNPEQAFDLSFLPNDGVGLAREEFIITNYIRIHPLALMNYAKLKRDPKNAGLIDEMDSLTHGYSNKTQFFVDKLAQGIGMLAAAFYPKDVILRFSDFKSNEYAGLIGGKAYEPVEANPMIGWRGASRYYSPQYEAAFALECKAVKKAREEYGLKNLKVMIPFCRTVEEGKQVIRVMEKNGLKRGVGGLEVYVMCEIPSNVILADQFSKIFDGFSIGSNDLTQLTLGLDRDSELVSHIYNERNDAVKRLIAQVIRTVHANRPRRKIGICGQAPSDFPDFAEFLVGEGIDSISLNPDTVVKTRLRIAKKEAARDMKAKGAKKRG